MQQCDRDRIQLFPRHLERLEKRDEGESVTLQFLKDHGYARNH